MLDLFKSPTFSDPELGEFRRTGGLWRGALDLGGISVRLALPGSRSAPDPQALEIARSVPSGYAGWRPLIETALFEHYAPYAEAVATGEVEPLEEAVPRLIEPREVWTHSSVEFVQVLSLDRELAVEIGYRVAWDEEHVVGARLRRGQLIELNGSVLPP